MTLAALALAALLLGEPPPQSPPAPQPNVIAETAPQPEPDPPQPEQTTTVGHDSKPLSQPHVALLIAGLATLGVLTSRLNRKSSS